MAPEAATPHAAAIYARISEDPSGQMLGVSRQLEDCEAYCAKRGWEVADRYVDNDISAYSGKPRPEFRRMLQDIREHRLDGVVVWHLDRLNRQPRELEEFLDVCDAAGVRHLGTVTGDVDLATHDGRFTARILCAVARKESDDKSRRVRRKMLELAQAGRPHGGHRAYGFESDGVTQRESEVAVLREAKDRLLAGETLRSVCVDLDTRGIKSMAGRPWNISTLRTCLTSHRMIGRRARNGEDVAKAIWEPVFNEAEWLRLRRLLLDPNRRTNRAARRYLLTGYLHCSMCGAKLVAHPKNGRRAYACRSGPGFAGCGRMRIMAEPLEEFVVEAVLHRLDSEALRKALNGGPKDSEEASIIDDIAIDEEQLQELASAYAEKQVSLPEWLSARRIIEARLEAARLRLSQRDRHRAIRDVAGHSEELRGRWPSLNLDQRRAVLGAVLDRIVVRPATRHFFDPGRLEPVWKL